MRSGVRRLVRHVFLLPVLFVAIAGSACDDNNAATTDPGTTTPTDFTVTETFNGTLFKNGGASYSFSIQRAGTITVTLKAVADTVNPAAPPPTVGMSLGSWDGTACSVQTGIFTDSAGLNASIAGTVNGAGTLCARVYDPANYITNPVTYTISVTHP